MITLHPDVVRETSMYGGDCAASVYLTEAKYLSPDCPGFLRIGDRIIRHPLSGHRWCVPCGENAWGPR